MKDGRGTDEYINKSEMATRLGVTVRTIDSWMAIGLLPYRKLGRLVRFDWGEVTEHLKARSRPVIVKPAPQAGGGIAQSLRERAAQIRRAETRP
jgi:excisionase family DNA binding protein